MALDLETLRIWNLKSHVLFTQSSEDFLSEA